MSRCRPIELLLLLALLPTTLLAQEAIDAGRAARHDVAIRIYSLTGSLRITTWEYDSVHVRGRAGERCVAKG